MSSLPEIMDTNCSCSACSLLACLSKPSQRIYGDRNADNTYIFFNSIDKNISTSTCSFDEIKQEQMVSKECQNEIEEFSDQDSGKLFDVPSQDHLKDTCDNVYQYTSSRNIMRSSAAKLSAQIMNVPLVDFESSLRQQERSPQAQVSMLTPLDIFEKIKEIYDTCSCNVCKCIGMLQNNETCNCKPCDCDSCKNIGRKVTISKNFTSLDFAGTGTKCLKLEADLFNEFTMQQIKRDCNCKPCQCVDCAKDSCISKLCFCKQCLCIECKARYTHNKYQKLVVAAVESDNQSHQGCLCSPCVCPECSHRVGGGPTSSLHHEMSTEINRPDGCNCEACINEACTSDGANTCSCERRNRVMRKPVQRDTEYDIRRFIVSQQNPCTQNLIAMFASIAKVYPDHHSVEERYCGRRESNMICDCKKEAADSVKPFVNHGNSDDNSKVYDDSVEDKPISINLEPQKLSLKTIGSCLENFEEPPEIRVKSKCSSKNALKRLNDDIGMLATCTGDFCDCTRCKCERCISKDEMLDPITKGEKITTDLFGNKMNTSLVRFGDDESQIHGYYESLNKESLLPFECQRNMDTSNSGTVRNKVLPDHCTHVNKLSRRLKIYHHEKPFEDSSNTIRANIDSQEDVNQEVSCKIVCDYSNLNHMNSGTGHSTELTYNESQAKICNTSDRNESNDSIQCPERRSAIQLNNIKYLDNVPETKHSKRNSPIENGVVTINGSLARQKQYEKKLCDINTLLSKSIHRSENKPRKWKCDKYSVRKETSVKESSRGEIGKRNNLTDKISGNQKIHQSNISISTLKNNSSQYCEQPLCYSKSNEKVHNDCNKLNAEKSKNILITTEWNDSLNEVSKKVKKTLKEYQTFSLCLTRLLEVHDYIKNNNEALTKSLQNLSGPIHTEHLGQINHETADIEPKKNKKLNNSVYNSSYNDCTFKCDISNTSILINDDLTNSTREQNIKPAIAVSEKTQKTMDDSNTMINKLDSLNIDLSSKITQDLVEPRDVIVTSPLTTEESNIKEMIDRTAECEVIVGLYRKQSLEKGIQEAVNAIKQATAALKPNYAEIHQVPYGHHNNVALLKGLNSVGLTHCVRPNRLSSPSQPIFSSILQLRASLKVSSLSVHKLSDSSIAVKWQVPKVLDNVQGYEVQLNGRTVHKIQDSMCYESVLCGLPRTAKTLVAIRTVTKQLRPFEHSPTATVVYRQ